MLAHVQRFAVASTTAKEITHDDVEMVRRFGAAFQKVVFELPLSDVTVVDGEKVVFECRVAMPRRREFTWCVKTSKSARPATKSSTRRTGPHASAAPLNNDDRGLLAFCATQIDALAANVGASTTE